MPNADPAIIRDPARLYELHRLDLLDTAPEASFDRLTRLVARVLNKPVVLISLVDADRQFFKSQIGLDESLAISRETPMTYSFCQHVVASGAALMIDDARRHPLVHDSPAIWDLGVVAYAGVPLTTRTGHHLGTLCAADTQAHHWTADEVDILREMAQSVMAEIELRDRIRQQAIIEEQLRQSEEHYRLVVTTMDNGMVMHDASGAIVACNPSAERILGLTADQLEGRTSIDPRWRTIHEDGAPFPGETHPAMITLRTGKPLCNVVMGVYRLDGELTWISINSQPVFQEGETKPVAVVATFQDITEQKLAEADIEQHIAELGELYLQVAYQNEHDPLTGLANRQLFEKSASEALSDARRTGHEVGICFVDLDLFKQTNDTFGHATGDHLLEQVARRLERSVRDGDTVARIAGDEFTIVLGNLSSRDEAVAVAERILAALNQPFWINTHMIMITSSIGLSFYPADGLTLDELLREADAALYQAKAMGRNACQMAGGRQKKDFYRRMHIQQALHSALDNGQFRLYYQPQYDLNSSRITGAEVLLRWQHPELGVISPDEFIPIAEQTGLIIPIGNWVLDKACRQAKAWQQQGYNLSVAINVSPVQFDRTDCAQEIAAALARYDLPPEYLTIELTEDVLVDRIEEKAASMMQIALMGVGVMIDDFGTGYSSLRYLQDLPLTGLKIDRGFVQDIGEDPAKTSKTTAIIATMAVVAHHLGLTVIAEGVETEQQVMTLRDLKCDALQGYLFSKPLPPAEMDALLAAQSSTALQPA